MKPKVMTTSNPGNSSSHKIIIGDARKLDQIPDQSVHLIVTSPPYWQLKDYGSDRQIGFGASYENYINDLNLVWQESERVLHPGCRLCINVGDQFARAAWYGRYKVLPIRSEIIRFCEQIGLDYMGAIIWQKRTNSNPSGGGAVMGSYPHPRNGILKIDYEFILLFRKPGQPPAVSAEQKAQSELSREEWNEYFSGHWNFPGIQQKKHLAMFPAELPKRLIRMFSFPGETVLDPFLGSGTTAIAAAELSRHSIGYEVDQESVQLIRDKFNSTSFPVRFSEQKMQAVPNYDNLPYLFRDPFPLKARPDTKSKSFGSKINKHSEPDKKYLRIREVVSATHCILSDGSKILLAGVEIPESKQDAARSFIEEKTRNQRVYFRQAEQICSENSWQPAYLFLENRTFINAHLIKAGLADTDQEKQFKYRKRFEKYQSERK